jgi:NADPH-dependent 2,4-dienoyl-CoA reductase/sulfur reductase-like enzyme
MKQVDIVIIGGGAAGMSAAVAAYDQGARSILIIERTGYLGGILRQCIHNGFGVHRFGEDLTGVEFAKRYEDMVQERGIPYLLGTFVLGISENLVVTAMNPEEGLIDLQAKAVVLAMGCRERTRNSLLIPGIRGAGVYTAGTAQKYLNMEGYLPGRRVVILGSGDIGLIMARQFVIEGARVEAVVEIMPYSSGLARNMKQCVEDFDIPVYFNSTITDIRGDGRVSSVTVSRVDENRQPLPETEWEIPCDTVLISAGLIPENELTQEMGIDLCPVTKGALVSDDLQTSLPGVFSCGNVLHVHDLVDFVSMESQRAGENAAAYIRGELNPVPFCDCIQVERGAGVGGMVPQYIRRDGGQDAISIMFRPLGIYKNATVHVEVDGKPGIRRKARVLTPGEMHEIKLNSDLIGAVGSRITVRVEE